MSDIERALIGLAKLRDPESQGMLAMSVTEMCVSKPLSARAEPIAGELLLTLARKVEEKVRISMANILADCEWAPHGVIKFLAFDAPSVAEKIILQSIRLTDADLISLADSGSVEHRCLIAERPRISSSISDAVSLRAEPPVISILAANNTAVLSRDSFERCLEAAEDDSVIGERLSLRDDLPDDIVSQLYTHVSKVIRDQLASRYTIAPDKLDAVTEFAAESAQIEDGDDAAARLIEQMQFAGTLNGEFAIKALSEGRYIIFDHAIAYLCGLTPEDWRKTLASSGVRTIALSCRAARIDKSVFPSVLKSMQAAGRVHDGIEEQAIATAARIFRDYSPGKAHDSLRRIADSV